jgi:hypothetical protein
MAGDDHDRSSHMAFSINFVRVARSFAWKYNDDSILNRFSTLETSQPVTPCWNRGGNPKCEIAAGEFFVAI